MDVFGEVESGTFRPLGDVAGRPGDGPVSTVDQWLTDVATSALVGSARREPPPAPDVLALDASDASAEHRLLASAAVADAVAVRYAVAAASDAVLAAAEEVRPHDRPGDRCSPCC